MRITIINKIEQSFMTHRINKPARYRVDGAEIWIENGRFYSKSGIVMTQPDGTIIRKNEIGQAIVERRSK